ncbi:MAG: hypothetical protein EP349_07700 [Alphaproteobacteria bacterium]|nr:MAG: hypothetical protein EP349_07700 [Alphaproteobacteria bacterium]
MKPAETASLSIFTMIFFVFGAFIGAMLSLFCTPLLWKLEKPTGLELAGHSGPAEGVIFLFAFIFGTVFAGVFLLRRIKKGRP